MNKIIYSLFAVAALSIPPVTAQTVTPGEEGMAAYLMTYFSDSDHSLHFAVSDDGYTFTALNDNKPVISGDSIAEQRGIRDPHIYRGPDNRFYLVLTDIHIFCLLYTSDAADA